MLQRYYSTQINSQLKKGPKGLEGQTRENVVSIDGPKAIKTVTTYNAKGRVVKRVTRKLKPAERHRILAGKFVPRLFADCCGPVRKTRNIKKKHI
jgi:hypothetical protein